MPPEIPPPAARPSADRKAALVAQVDPGRCVTCGICAGSCAPMGVGPPGRTGRSQLDDLRRLLGRPDRTDGRVLVLACEQGVAGWGPSLEAAGGECHVVACAGNLHTSVVERALRAGAPGVLILSCPPRDCWGREGPRWLRERLYHDREAELQARVDRRRVRVAYVGAGEGPEALAALAAFRADLALLGPPFAEPESALEAVCVPAELETEETGR
jgi:coenzyme F420-reducing hydrogenase delta subunit